MSHLTERKIKPNFTFVSVETSVPLDKAANLQKRFATRIHEHDKNTRHATDSRRLISPIHAFHFDQTKPTPKKVEKQVCSMKPLELRVACSPLERCLVSFQSRREKKRNERMKEGPMLSRRKERDT